MSHRIERLNNLIREEISELLQRQVKDPRLNGLIAVTEVSTSPDLRYARVFVSSFSAEDKDKILKGLTAAAGFFRTELAKNLRIRRVPELNFFWDDSIERGDHLIQLIDKVNTPDEG